jgi:methyl-accepting chemotaxis protein
MKVVNRLSMRKKLLVAPILAATLMLASCLIAYFVIRQQRVSLQSIYQERIPALKTAADAGRTLAGVQASTYKVLAMMDSDFPADKIDAVIRESKSDLAEVARRLETAATAAATTAQEKENLRNAGKALSDYRKVIDEVLAVATVQVSMATALMSKAQIRYDELALRLKNLREVEDRETEVAYHAAEDVAVRANSTVFFSMVLSVVLSVVVALYIGSSIVRAVGAIRTATAKLSEGNLGQLETPGEGNEAAFASLGEVEREIDVRRVDEIGDLSRSFFRMVSYLKNMAAISEAIASGDLSHQVEPCSKRDTLGQAFVRMTDGLRALVRHVRDSAAEVASASGRVAKASEESARVSRQASVAIGEVISTMHEMNANSQSIVQNTQMQAASITETSTSIDQMIASIQRVADSSKVLLDISERSRQEVQTGIACMKRAADGLTRINASMLSSAEIIHVLSSRADDIGRIVEVIDELADQTNLLALNAAIEAARAGEHGLGFAVVADEVRKLAEKSAQSTQEIAELIRSIQKEAHKAVENMQKNVAIVDEGLSSGAELNTALTKISQVVTEVHKFAQEIGGATKEQAHGSSQIAKAATRLNDITHEINAAIEEEASGMQAVAKATDQMRELVQQSSSGSAELAASAEQMLEMSRSLLERMNRFRLQTRQGATPESPSGRAVGAHGGQS